MATRLVFQNCSFLAEELKVSERNIVLERGHKSREKVVRIEGLSAPPLAHDTLKPSDAHRESFFATNVYVSVIAERA